MFEAYPARMNFLRDLLFADKTKMVTAETALGGRDHEMPVPERHFVLGTPLVFGTNIGALATRPDLKLVRSGPGYLLYKVTSTSS